MSEPWSSPAPLLDVVPASPPPRGGAVRRILLTGAVAVAAVGVAGTAWATASFLSGGGAQPEDVLPADTVALAKVDLDPAVGQKVAVYRLARKFPSVAESVSSEDDIRDDLLRRLFQDVPDIDYDRDIATWAGDRAGVAAVPVEGAEPAPVAAVAFTDRAAAEAALGRLTADSPETHYAFSELADYVLLGPTQELVDAVATTDRVLADQDSFSDDVDELDGDQVLTAWADLDAVWRATPEEVRDAAGEGQPFEPSGRVVVGGRAVDDGIEVVGRTFDLSTGQDTPVIGQQASSGMVGRLPDDTVAAIGVTGLGDAAVSLYESMRDNGDPLQLVEETEGLGLELPADLGVLLGEETVGAAFSDSEFAGRSRTDDPERARTVLEGLLSFSFGLDPTLTGEVEEVPLDAELERELELLEQGLGPDGEPLYGEPVLPPEPALPPGPMPLDEPLPPAEAVEPDWYFGEEPAMGSVGFRGQELPADQLRVLDDGLVVGTSADAVDRMASDDGSLGDSPVFRRALPDGAGAGLVVFVDLARVGELGPAGSVDGSSADFAALEAFGLSVTGGEDASFRVRLTLR